MPWVRAGNREIEVGLLQLEFLGLDKNSKLLGCGTQACAYEADDGKVVKLTKDRLDAMTSFVVMNLPKQNRRWAIPVHGVYQLDNTHYAIVVDKADPLPLNWGNVIDYIFDLAKPWRDNPKIPWSTFYWNTRTDLDSRGGYDAVTVLDVVNDAVTGFNNLGLDWADFHSGNWGFYRGKPVVLDLGLSEQMERPPVPNLKQLAAAIPGI